MNTTAGKKIIFCYVHEETFLSPLCGLLQCLGIALCFIL